ncbi:protein-export chaperone SecB [Solibacillus sp. FSL R7-0682]|uniref:protein-export chaperone SecB n=1 Tax=Solibacillus sp. FSL R7-0682 TaxID=2921690 RepID=UPI0030F91E0F
MLSDLKIDRVRVDKSEFRFNTNFHDSPETRLDLNISYDVDFMVSVDNENSGIVLLECGVNSNEEFQQVPFVIEVSIVGFFSVEKGKIQEYFVNAVSVLFPYLRAHISTLTSISGIPPVTLPSINVIKLLESIQIVEENNAAEETVEDKKIDEKL